MAEDRSPAAGDGPLRVASSYDTVAEDYAREIADELVHKPLDRKILDRFATRVEGRGRVCDVGCGPGHVARYLHARSVDVFGLDLSSRMVEIAKVRNSEN